MLTAVPTSWLSSSYEVRDSGARVVGVMRFSLWAGRGAIAVREPEAELRISRDGVLFGPIVLRGRDGEIARAAKLSAFSRAFLVEWGGRVFVLRSPNAWFREMRLTENDREIGSAVPGGVFSRLAQFDLPEALPLELRLFIAWLALFVWRRWQDSSVSFSGVPEVAPRHG